MEEEQDVIQESLPEVDETTESSTVEETEEQLVEPTTSQEEQGAEQQVPYDRFKEVNDEKNYWRQQAQSLTQVQPVRSQEPEDPYANIADPQTKLFYQDQDKRMLKIANKVAEEKSSQILRQNEILTQQLAQLQHNQFKQTNTDVREGSQEEARIAQLVATGAMSLEEATWAVMGAKRVAGASTGRQLKQTKKTELKSKANLATQGVPAQSGLPDQEKGFLDSMADTLDKDWDGNL